jgi:hypothetical protein
LSAADIVSFIPHLMCIQQHPLVHFWLSADDDTADDSDPDDDDDDDGGMMPTSSSMQ